MTVSGTTGALLPLVFQYSTYGEVIDLDVSATGDRVFAALGDLENQVIAWSTTSGNRLWFYQVDGDTQAVKCIGVRGPRGYDAAKGVVGRKRVALVDAEGHWLAVAVVPASVQDRDTPEALDTGKARWPTLREGVYDGAFAAERCREWSNLHGMRHRVVARDPQAEGFVVLARRWVVERSFGWLSHWGGLARDRAGRLDVSAARLAVVGILSGFEALLNPMPVRAPAQ